MLESVPPFVEAAIYCYFGLVAALGCYVHGRLWLGTRDGRREDGAGLES